MPTHWKILKKTVAINFLCGFITHQPTQAWYLENLGQDASFWTWNQKGNIQLLVSQKILIFLFYKRKFNCRCCHPFFFLHSSSQSKKTIKYRNLKFGSYILKGFANKPYIYIYMFFIIAAVQEIFYVKVRVREKKTVGRTKTKQDLSRRFLGFFFKREIACGVRNG